MPAVSSLRLPLIESWSSIRSSFSFLVHRNKSPIEKVHASPDPAGGTAFELFEHTGACRAAAERFISERFAESYGAHIEAFMPRLFSLRNLNGTIYGAFGLRSANHRLFVEHYLDQPIEQAIALQTGSAVARSSIVEVGHFSGAVPGAMRAMIWLLTERLHREGFQWVAFTGTSSLRNAFYRIGLFPIEIQAAAVECIPEDVRATWGSYYDHSPWVLVGKVDDGFRTLVQNAPQAPRKPGWSA